VSSLEQLFDGICRCPDVCPLHAPYTPSAPQAAKPDCTCIKDGGMKCKYPHPCGRCYLYHPGVSCYWHAHGKTPADKDSGGRTFVRSDGSIGCAECCNGDRCDDPTHRDRENCTYCLGSGTPSAPQAAKPERDELVEAAREALSELIEIADYGRVERKFAIIGEAEIKSINAVVSRLRRALAAQGGTPDAR
jgi:hypothetical protein